AGHWHQAHPLAEYRDPAQQSWCAAGNPARACRRAFCGAEADQYRGQHLAFPRERGGRRDSFLAMALQLVTAEEMRALEQASVQEAVSLDQLMDNAGLAVAKRVQRLHGCRPGRALVLVGPGNNGGDGLVCAE